MALQGYCPSTAACRTFAVALGDFGSPLTSALDAAAFGDLAAYLQPLCGLPACLEAAGAHAPISSWFWDGWSPASSGARSFLSACLTPHSFYSTKLIPHLQKTLHVQSGTEGAKISSNGCEAAKHKAGECKHGCIGERNMCAVPLI